MSLINISNLSFCYDGSCNNIFENLNLQLDTSWKLGLIGRNGRGKTTLLRILNGEFLFSGSITAQVKFEYFPYATKNTGGRTVDALQEICGAESWRILREAKLLGLSEDALRQKFALLSHGERTKALLAAMFLREGSFLLIDEPTNHLDFESRQQLSKYLSAKSGFILVSHDRSLLDGCVDHILSINRTDIKLVRGNFSSWLLDKENQDRFEAAENERVKKDINRLHEASRRAAEFSSGAEGKKYGTLNSGLHPDRGYLGHKSAKLMRRSKNIERRHDELINEKFSLLKNIEVVENLKISPLGFHTSRLLQLHDVSVSYGGNIVCSGIGFDINEGDRIVLRGKNGSGKSSILRLIFGADIEHTGEILKNGQLKISYVPQSTEHLSGSLVQAAQERGLDMTMLLAILDKLGLSRRQFETNLNNFSAGERKKVLLAMSLCERAHLYIWDEPLNYVDVLSRMQLEQMIAQYQPTMLLVEHDEAFCASVSTKTIKI